MPYGDTVQHQIITLLTNHALDENQHPQRRADLLNTARHFGPLIASPQRRKVQRAYNLIVQPTHNLGTAIRRNDRAALHRALDHGALIKPEFLFDALARRRSVLFQDMMHAYHGPLTSRDDNGYTLLHQAVFSYDLDAIQTLLSRGAALNARGEVDGVTPLHLAVEHDQYTVAKILIDAGAQITLRESVNGYTPLHDTAYGNHVAIAKDLLLPRLTILQINARDPEFGKTPLHLAVSRKNYDMVALLMQHGADPYLKTKQRVSVTFRRIFPAQDAFALAKNDQRLLAMLRGKA